MEEGMSSEIEKKCLEIGMKMTEQRRIIARVLSEACDHPDVEEVYRRASLEDSKISLATVYRTVRLFEEANLLKRHDFGDGRARYESITEHCHHHLLDMRSGQVIEFHSEELEELQRKIARDCGYELVGHKVELYGIPLKKE
jgi:Fur family ferric uptake transcriptional regulator